MVNYGNLNISYESQSYSTVLSREFVIDNIGNQDTRFSFSTNETALENGVLYIVAGAAMGGWGDDTYYFNSNYNFGIVYDGSSSTNDTLYIRDYLQNVIALFTIDNRHIALTTAYSGSILILNGFDTNGLIENVQFYDTSINNLTVTSTKQFVETYRTFEDVTWEEAEYYGLISSTAGNVFNNLNELKSYANSLSPVSLSTNEAYAYLASNTDLLSIFGNDTSTASNHYFLNGISEGRSKSSFDAWKYLASNTDLISVFGSDTSLATQHFVSGGFLEGRVTTNFNATQYLSNYSDLANAFNNDSSLAVQHFVKSGFLEGRNDRLLSVLQTLNYIASNSDLISVFGINTDSAYKHYLNFGQSEGRSISAFSASDYLAKYSDLASAFGNDQTLALKHYIQIGHGEGRTDASFFGSGSTRGSSYYNVVEGPTWEDAEANANKFGGHLVSINDGEENDFLVDSFKDYNIGNWTESINNDIYWIGLSQSNNLWEWINGDPVNFTNWGVKEPFGNGDKVHMILEGTGNNNLWTGVAGKWNDEYSQINLLNPSWHGFYGIAEIPLSYFSISDLSIKEGDTGNITISRTGGINTSQKLNLSSSSGTASSGIDFTPLNETITFAKGEESKTISVSTTQDIQSEGDENFSLTLSASTTDAVPAQINNGSATVTILESLSDTEALNYIASHQDLINVFGTNISAASNHYVNSGFAEGRAKDNFDEWGYLASNTDLMKVFGSNTTQAIKHYISFGKSEGRKTNLFDAEAYLNNYADLKFAFGNDHTLAKKHYVNSGFYEGRYY